MPRLSLIILMLLRDGIWLLHLALSLVSALLFLYILFNQLTSPLQVKANYWHTPAFFIPNTPLSSTQASPTLEWLVSSPPAFHHYNELPISS